MRILSAAAIAATLVTGAHGADTTKPVKTEKAAAKQGVALQPVLAKRTVRGTGATKVGVGVTMPTK